MALPLTGPLGINDIRTELGIPSKAPFQLDLAENGDNANGYPTLNQASYPYLPSASNPAAISEWYGYNHTATKKLTIYFSIMPGPDDASTSYTCDPDWAWNYYSGRIRLLIQHQKFIAGFYQNFFYVDDFPSPTTFGLTTHPCKPTFYAGFDMQQNPSNPDRVYINVRAWNFQVSDFRDVAFGLHTTIIRPQDNTGFIVPYSVYQPGQGCPNNPPPFDTYCFGTSPNYVFQSDTNKSLPIHINIKRNAIVPPNAEWTTLDFCV